MGEGGGGGGVGGACLVGGGGAGRSWATSKCGAVDVRLSRVMVSVFGVSAGVFRSTSISASGLYWRGSPISLMMRISPFLILARADTTCSLMKSQPSMMDLSMSFMVDSLRS